MGLPAIPTPPVGTVFTVRFFINASGGGAQGWVEKYYLNANSMPAALVAGRALWTVRKHLLATDCILAYAYCSDEAVKGDSRLLGISQANSIGDFDTGEAKTLHAWNVLLLRFEAGPIYHIVRPLRGIPNTEDLHNFTCSDAYSTKVDALFDELIVDTKIRVKLKPGDPAPGLGNYRTIDAAAILRFSERRDGRPFGLRHGRSRRLVG